ncbi:MAG: lysylphosphatidylglycerol synthase transmembrane domain-containing protein [Anaerolineaceae bacterium]
MSNKPQTNWKLIIRWIGTLLSVLLMVYLIITAGIDEIIHSLGKLSFGTILAVTGLIFLSRIATFARWHVLLQIDKIQVNWRDSLRLTFAGLFAANFLPSTIGGDVVRLAGAIRIGVGGSLAAASLIVDRLVGMAGMACALPFAITPFSALMNINKSSIHGVNQTFGFVMSSKVFWGKIKEVFSKIMQALAYWYRHPKYLILAFLFTFIHMICIFLIIQILVIEMGESISFWKIVGLWSLTYFISLMPISINGIGLQEVSITSVFQLFGGLTHATSLSIALICRALWIIGSLPGAFFVSSILSGDTYTELSKNKNVDS